MTSFDGEFFWLTVPPSFFVFMAQLTFDWRCQVKGANLGSGDAALDHDLLVWFGDFHCSLQGIEPAALTKAVSEMGTAVRDGKAEVELETAESVATWQSLVGPGSAYTFGSVPVV